MNTSMLLWLQSVGRTG